MRKKDITIPLSYSGAGELRFYCHTHQTGWNVEVVMDDGAGYGAFVDADAIKLRDALIELYPLPVKSVEPKVTYELGHGTDPTLVFEVTEAPFKQRVKLGEFRTDADARLFIQSKEA